MQIFDTWAKRWNVPQAAIAELRAMYAMQGAPDADPREPANSEARVQSEMRLSAFGKNVILWRNNVGALLDKRGVPVRYGLLTDSKAVNEKIKSADLIGIRRVLITPAHVGTVLGQFCSREVKWRGWQPGEDKHREGAQTEWANLVGAWGGDAKITANPDDL